MIIVFLFLWVFTIGLLYWAGQSSQSKFIIVSLLFLAVRLLAWKLLPTGLIEDHQQYYQTAVNLVEGNYLLHNVDMGGVLLLLPFKFVYIFILSKVMLVMGIDIVFALGLNLLMDYISLSTVYFITTHYAGTKSGYLSGLIYSLFPSTLVYSCMVGIEVLFTAFFLLMVCNILSYLRKPGFSNCLLIAVFAALSHLIRPVMTPIILCLGFVIIYFCQKISVKIRLFHALALMILFLSIVLTSLSGIKNKIEYDVENSGPWFSLMHGSSFRTNGRFDCNLGAQVLPYLAFPDKCNLICKKLTLRNYETHWKELPGHLAKKLFYNWLQEEFANNTVRSLDLAKTKVIGVFWWKYKTKIDWFFNCSYYLVLICGVIGLYRYSELIVYRKVVVGLYFIFILMHLLLEANSRYHFHLTPLMIIPAGILLAEYFQKSKGWVYSLKARCSNH